ncbi:MAG: hypothetical protein IPN17_12795 [Deltaproteobacteria bacterium]|nr:hypothetical protein [Deltaproteobacteria bacterium]
MNRWIVAALCSSLVVGCGASNDTPIVAADSGTGGAADTGSPVDTGASTDRGSATTDRGSATTDRGSATTDRGARPNCGTWRRDQAPGRRADRLDNRALQPAPAPT